VTVTGSNPTGEVDFDLFGPDDPTCSGTPAYSQDADLSNGAASTSNTSFVASTPGTWRWHIVYNGDANNPAKDAGCGAKSFVITAG
jgi:hypothetical protein